MTRSIHDNFVLGYSVDAEEKRIVIRTEYRNDGEPFERTDARFEGVLGYLLRDDLGGILFDITEEPMEFILQEHASDFERGRRYGWPWSAASSEHPLEFVASRGAKAFRIQGQTAFDGFVIARELHLDPGPNQDA